MRRFAPQNVRERKSESGTIGAGPAAFDEHEDDEGDGPPRRRRARARARAARRHRAGVDQPVDDEPETDRDEESAAASPCARRGLVAGLRDAAAREGEHERRDGDVEVEEPSPRGVRDDPSAGDGTDRGGDGAERRPRADRAARAAPVGVRGADERETPGYEERGTDALDGARDDERERVRCSAAEAGGEREQDRRLRGTHACVRGDRRAPRRRGRARRGRARTPRRPTARRDGQCRARAA